jgi:hypothetical protein
MRKRAWTNIDVNTILSYAQLILYTLLALRPSPDRKLSLQASFILLQDVSKL